MHVILGDGEMSKKELTETLKDLWTKAGEDEFWFVVQGKSAPTETDTNLLTWLSKNEIWFEVVTDDDEAMDEIYGEAQETYVVKRLGQKIVSLLNTKPQEGEEADVLGLFVSEDPGAEEDRWLNNIIESAMKEGFKAYALNDGLIEIDLSSGTPAAAEAEEEEEPKKVPAKKAVAKKAPAPSSNGGKTAKTYTRDELEEMDLDQLKDIAVAKGLELLPSRTRMATYIDHILGESTPAVEVTQPPVTTTTEATEGDTVTGALELVDNGWIEKTADLVIEKLIKALQA